MGFTINTMSLGGLAIAIGSLVDDAIVDVENVYKRLHENKLKPVEERLSILEVVFNASKEVRMPILNSTLIIVVSFVPLFFLTGMEGRMLVPLGIAFIVALAALLLSFRKRQKEGTEREQRLVRSTQDETVVWCCIGICTGT